MRPSSNQASSAQKPRAKAGAARAPSSHQLEQILAKSVGQPWPQVWAALQAQFEGVPSVKLLRLADVAQRTSMQNGKVRVLVETGDSQALEDSPHAFYLEPRTKLLCANVPRQKKLQAIKDARAKQEKEASERRRVLSDTLVVIKDGPVWVAVELAPLESAGFDVFLRRHVTAADQQELALIYGRAKVYAGQKRELTYREARQLGL